MQTKRIVTDAMFMALCAALSFAAVNLGNMKITLESLPVVIAAMLLGPIDGALVGGLGSLIYQLLSPYGVSATTLLWVMPYMVCGLIVGAYSKGHAFELTARQSTFIIAVSEILITLLNTGVIYIDSKIYGYYTPAVVFGALGIRIVVCVIKTAAFCALCPALVKRLKGFVK